MEAFDININFAVFIIIYTFMHFYAMFVFCYMFVFFISIMIIILHLLKLVTTHVATCTFLLHDCRCYNLSFMPISCQ